MKDKITKGVLFRLGVFFLAGLGVLMIIGVFVFTNESLHPDMSQRFLAPSREYPFGTDHLGRCIFSRIAEGGLLTLQVSTLSLAGTVFIGVPLVDQCLCRRKIDTVIMRIVDGFAILPDFILAIVIAGLLGPSLQNVLIAIVAVKWVQYARLTRGTILSEKQKEYILSARSIGCRHVRVLWKHLLPAVVPQTITLASLDMGKIILIIASLSYLGLGAQPPIPEWGAMLNDARPYFQTEPLLMIIPGTMIFLTVLSFNLIGDGLRESLKINSL